MVQDLKIKNEYFEPVKRGLKRAEVRFNDRNYAEGDILVLHEIRDGKLTGRVVRRIVLHVQKLDGIGMEKWVLLSMV